MKVFHNFVLTVSMCFAMITAGMLLSSCSSKLDDLRAVADKPDAESESYALAPEHCRIDWTNFDEHFSSLDESCLEHLPDSNQARAAIVAAGLDPDEFEEELFAFDLFHQATAESSGGGSGSQGMALDGPTASMTIDDTDVTVTVDPEDPAIDVHVERDPLDLDFEIEDPVVDGNLTCEDETISGNASLDFDVPFSGRYGAFSIYNGCIWRCRHVYGHVDASGSAHVRVAGNITGTANNWSLTIDGSVNGVVNALVTVSMHLTGPRGRSLGVFHVGTATINAAVTAHDSATMGYNCDSGRFGSVTGRPQISVPVRVHINSFHGILFPRLNGRIITAIRNALRNWANTLLTPLAQNIVDQKVAGLVDQYVAKKQQVLNNLMTNLNGIEPCEDCLPMQTPVEDPLVVGNEETIPHCAAQATNTACTSCCITAFPVSGSAEQTHCLSEARCAYLP